MSDTAKALYSKSAKIDSQDQVLQFACLPRGATVLQAFSPVSSNKFLKVYYEYKLEAILQRLSFGSR